MGNIYIVLTSNVNAVTEFINKREEITDWFYNPNLGLFVSTSLDTIALSDLLSSYLGSMFFISKVHDKPGIDYWGKLPSSQWKVFTTSSEHASSREEMLNRYFTIKNANPHQQDSLVWNTILRKPNRDFDIKVDATGYSYSVPPLDAMNIYRSYIIERLSKSKSDKQLKDIEMLFESIQEVHSVPEFEEWFKGFLNRNQSQSDTPKGTP